MQFASGAANLTICQPLDAIATENIARLTSGIDAFDELIGGGIVPGGICLIGGEPGVGKSTFMMQLAAAVARQLGTVAYLSGEESPTQIKMRAERLGFGNLGQVLLISEPNLEPALGSLASHLPRLVIIDSIQTVFTPTLDASPGSVGQVRECAALLTKFGKDRNLPVMIVGHVTKEGAIAGPKVLEHIVDTVLYFEGELTSQFRLLRAFKNRYGATGEVAVFHMGQAGLEPVKNPSDVFVSRDRLDTAGVVIVPLLEGTRCILAELQTLVSRSFLTNPRRVVSGLDGNRLSMIIAILERHARLRFYNQDVFANVAAGLRLDDPGADLGLALALASSLTGRPLPPDLLCSGELTLSGEVRPVSGLERRLTEGRRFGFKRFLVPKAAQVTGNERDGILRVRTLTDALDTVLPRVRQPLDERDDRREREE